MVRINYSKISRDLKILESTVAGPVITGILAVLTIFYASSISERLPSGVKGLVSSVFVQVGFLGLVMYLQTSNPTWALALVGGTFLALFLSYIISVPPGPRLTSSVAEQLKNQEDIENANQLKNELDALINARNSHLETIRDNDDEDDENEYKDKDRHENVYQYMPGTDNFLYGLVDNLRDTPPLDMHDSVTPLFVVGQFNNQAHTATPHADTRASLGPLTLSGTRAKWATKLNPPFVTEKFSDSCCEKKKKKKDDECEDSDNKNKPANGANNKSANGAANNKPASGAANNKPVNGAGNNKPVNGANNKPVNGAGNNKTLTGGMSYDDRFFEITGKAAVQLGGGEMLGCIAESCGMPMNPRDTQPQPGQYCRDDANMVLDNITQNNVSVLINLLIAELKLNFTQEEIKQNLCGVLQVILNNCNKPLKEFFEDPEPRKAFLDLLCMANNKAKDSQSLAIIYDILSFVSREMKNLITERLNNAITSKQVPIAETLSAACSKQINLNQICGFSDLAQMQAQLQQAQAQMQPQLQQMQPGVINSTIKPEALA